MSGQPSVRLAASKDVCYILQFIRELADYEKALDEVEATEESLRATLSFADDPVDRHSGSDTAQRRGAVYTALVYPPGDSVPVGMALYFYNYSTWRAAPGIYLEDLYVQPAARGSGYGLLLLRWLANKVLECGGKRLEWSVLKWNEPSIRFYEDKIRAQAMHGWMQMRVEGDEKLKELAG